MEMLESSNLDCSGDHGDLNSLEISGLILDCKEVIRLFDFCRILLI